MIHRQQLLKDLQALLPKIEQDILAYTESKPELIAYLQGEYAKAKAANRTAEHFIAWREAQITQAAVAWILTCVFVRFLEDNELLDAPLISGPAGGHKQSRLQQARDRLTVYFNDHPIHAEREYLQDLFRELEQLPAMGELLDHVHNPLWQLPLSVDGAKQLIDFFQRLDPETGEIVHDFTDPDWDTRFLGDLYQDLSESVRKRYALLQTPEFVEAFILDYTLEPAKATFGLPGLRLIDPTCGSGHFLLTSFERLFDDWVKREPATNSRALAQRALDAIHGVDINPYAIAIARFRLLIAAMKASGSDKIKAAPDFRFNLAVGDSLLLGRRHDRLDPASILDAKPDQPKAALVSAKLETESCWRQMISLQEELDWRSYKIYGLIDDDLCYGATPPAVRLGERPFEIALARRAAAGEQTTWFQRHGSTPITEIPGHWPADYRALTERRLQAMQDNRWIRLIEQPEYKRRWNREPWEKRQQRALKDWLLDHLEKHCSNPELQTCAQLADRTRHDDAFQQVAALYTGSDTFDAQALVSDLVAADNVPQMAAARYKPKAIPKFRAWQETWDKQRAEDAIDARTELDPPDPEYLTKEQANALKAKQIGEIPLPPKYAATDFRKPSYWPLRGKLDVPKERFFSLPHCEKEGDNTLVIGWAGLNHLQRAQAIAGWYLERKEQEGWEAERLKPMLTALDELIPWLKQWHNEIDPEFGERLGNYYGGFLSEELRQLDLSRDDLTVWAPLAARRSRKRKA